jgi:hypothetical protein
VIGQPRFEFVTKQKYLLFRCVQIRSDVRIPARERNISLLQTVQAGCGPHSSSYSMGNGVISPEIKRPGREFTQFTSIQCRDQEYADLYLYSPLYAFIASIWQPIFYLYYVVEPSALVRGYQRFRVTCCLHGQCINSAVYVMCALWIFHLVVVGGGGWPWGCI